MKQDKLIYQEPVMEIMILLENDIATGIVEASNTGDDSNIGGSKYDDFFNGF